MSQEKIAEWELFETAPKDRAELTFLVSSQKARPAQFSRGNTGETNGTTSHQTVTT